MTVYEHADYDVSKLKCMMEQGEEAANDHPADACVKAYKCCTGPKTQCNPTFTHDFGPECRSCIGQQAERYEWRSNQNIGVKFAEACWTGVVDECRMLCPRFTPVGGDAHDYCLDCLVTNA